MKELPSEFQLPTQGEERPEGEGAAGIEAGTGTENLACVCIKGLLDQAAEPATNERNH